MTKLDDALKGVTRLGIDTAPVIYFMEANPQYDALVTEIFQRISNGLLEGYTSVITLENGLVLSIRKGNATLVQDVSKTCFNAVIILHRFPLRWWEVLVACCMASSNV